MAPGDLAVIMGVQVDKTRRDQLSTRVDLFGALAGDATDLGNAAVFERDIGFEQFAAKTVGNRAAADHEIWIVSHDVSSRIWFCCRIMGCHALLSTTACAVQGCISLASGAPELPCGLRSVTSASRTVKI